MIENKINYINKKEWRSSFSLSRRSKEIVDTLVKCKIVKNYSDGIDTILSVWAESSKGKEVLMKANKVSYDILDLRKNLSVS